MDGLADVDGLVDVDGLADTDDLLGSSDNINPDIRSSVKPWGLLLNDWNSNGLDCESVCCGLGTSCGNSSETSI